jgi:hypothetical protein
MPSSSETDVAKLTKFIALPLAPREVHWQVVEQGVRTGSVGPTDFELVAVMTFDDASIQQLKDEMVEQTNPKEAYVAKTFVKPWFPDSVRRLFAADAAYPDYFKVGGMRLDPAPFRKGALQDGYAILTGNEVLLYLHTT